MSEELKPCPFCGEPSDDCYYHVGCPKCGVYMGNAQYQAGGKQQDVVAAWNRRAPDLRAIEELGNWLSKEIHEQIEHNNYGNQDCLWNVERELKRIVEKYRTEKDS